ncbi:MAG TPA: hypothetical protein VKZ95_04710 [Sphingobacteriaceae bacterium]|nr:hypothetical protein [Sphingobacteriaceae bacterium]
MSSVQEIAKEITLEAIRTNGIVLPSTTKFDEISDYNQRRANEIGEFYKTIVKKINESYEL